MLLLWKVVFAFLIRVSKYTHGTPAKCANVSSAYPSLFASSEILTGECLQHNDPIRNKRPRFLVDPFQLATLTGSSGAGVMTQRTFRFTKHLLMSLLVAFSIALVIFLEVTA